MFACEHLKHSFIYVLYTYISTLPWCKVTNKTAFNKQLSQTFTAIIIYVLLYFMPKPQIRTDEFMTVDVSHTLKPEEPADPA